MSAPGELFGRVVAAELGPEGFPGIRITGLRMAFKVSMSTSRNPNTATLQIYNPSPETIALAETPRSLVRILAGYTVAREIFQGTPVKNGIHVVRNGPDRILKIEAADGGRALRETFITVSFATGTTLQQVFSVVSAQLALPLGMVIIDQSASLPHGIVMAAQASDVLDRIAEISSADWYIRDGALYVVPVGGSTFEPVAIFSSRLGNLIGSPSKTDKGIEITALLDSSMRPGRLFTVISDRINGDQVAQDVEFFGDNGYSNDFFVRIIGKALAAA